MRDTRAILEAFQRTPEGQAAIERLCDYLEIDYTTEPDGAICPRAEDAEQVRGAIRELVAQGDPVMRPFAAALTAHAVRN